MEFIIEKQRVLPVIEDVDVCVLGGSCTGVFAAVRAARLGAKVVIVEKQNCFGGVATSGMINIWHSLMDTNYEKQIIGGLTQEVIERLRRRNAVAVKEKQLDAYFFNTEELKIELDELISEAKVIPYLHTIFTEPWIEDNTVKAIFIENKDGRSAIKAKVFIDATGDADLCVRSGMGYREPLIKQPPTTVAKCYGFNSELYGMASIGDFDLKSEILKHGHEFGLHEGWGWSSEIPNTEGLTVQAITRVNGVNCSDAKSLTKSEMEGRRQVRAVFDLIRKYGPADHKISLVGLCSYIGIRETRHIQSLFQLTEEDILMGRFFEDSIANGTYRVDVHHDDKPGVTFKYLDGTQVYYRNGFPKEVTRWRNEINQNPTFYQIPYRSLIPLNSKNVICCGRMIDADPHAFGAVRVMVNLNQTGEAAGVASFIALNTNKSVNNLDINLIRDTMIKGGSILF